MKIEIPLRPLTKAWQATQIAASDDEARPVLHRTALVEVFEDHGLRILVDTPSLPYVRGAIVDYVEGLQGAGFKVENPNVIAACGCGSSFRVADEQEVSAV